MRPSCPRHTEGGKATYTVLTTVPTWWPAAWAGYVGAVWATEKGLGLGSRRAHLNVRARDAGSVAAAVGCLVFGILG